VADVCMDVLLNILDPKVSSGLSHCVRQIA
jgi:hypothetical protein